MPESKFEATATVKTLQGERVKFDDSVPCEDQMYVRLTDKIIIGIAQEKRAVICLWREVNDMYKCIGEIAFIDSADNSAISLRIITRTLPKVIPLGNCIEIFAALPDNQRT